MSAGMQQLIAKTAREVLQESDADEMTEHRLRMEVSKRLGVEPALPKHKAIVSQAMQSIRRSRDASSETVDQMGKHDDRKSEIPKYCIDAGSLGNIARFINHSCEPNLSVQCVLSSHRDIKLARVALFAADNIPPLQELAYDYGYALDSVFGPDGKVKRMPCYCDATDCRKPLF